jgi:ABC-type xylose transport system permease subunit
MADPQIPKELVGALASIAGAVAKVCHRIVVNPNRKFRRSDLASMLLGCIVGATGWLICEVAFPSLQTAAAIICSALGARLFSLAERATGPVAQALLKKLGIDVEVPDSGSVPFDDGEPKR